MNKNALPAEISIVTGAGSGIGLAATRMLSQQLPVVAIGRTASKLEKLAAELGAAVIPCPMDVSSRSDVHGLRDRLHSSGSIVRALINNAGLARSGAANLPLVELEQNWDAVIATKAAKTGIVIFDGLITVFAPCTRKGSNLFIVE